MGGLRGTSVRAEVRDLLDGTYVATCTATRAGRYRVAAALLPRAAAHAPLAAAHAHAHAHADQADQAPPPEMAPQEMAPPEMAPVAAQGGGRPASASAGRLNTNPHPTRPRSAAPSAGYHPSGPCRPMPAAGARPASASAGRSRAAAA